MEQDVKATLPRDRKFGRMQPLQTFPCAENDDSCTTTVLLYTVDVPPNRVVVDAHGIARGSASLANHAPSAVLQQFQQVFGAEQGGVTKNLQKSVEMAELRMVDAARRQVANTSLKMRIWR